MAAGRDDRDAREDLPFAVGPAFRTPVADELELRLDVARNQPRVLAERDLPLRLLGDDRGAREGPGSVRGQEPAGMVEVKMAHRDEVDGCRVEAGGPEGRNDPGALVAAHVARLVVDPIADPGLDENAPARRLDEEAVQRLEQAVLVVDL